MNNWVVIFVWFAVKSQPQLWLYTLTSPLVCWSEYVSAVDRSPFRCHRIIFIFPPFVPSLDVEFPNFSVLTNNVTSGSRPAFMPFFPSANEKPLAQFTQGANYITSTSFHLASASLPDRRDSLFQLNIRFSNERKENQRNQGDKMRASSKTTWTLPQVYAIVCAVCRHANWPIYVWTQGTHLWSLIYISVEHIFYSCVSNKMSCYSIL